MKDNTTKILEYFEEINAIPRCSGNEARVCEWLKQWAADRNLDFQSDAGGNLVVKIPASPGKETAPGIVLQGHMDMVCEKTPESGHDFGKDAIVSHREGDWLTASGTTLGADNGIALAYMLALAEATTITHPPMELLFTVDEETGLNGAKALKPGFIKGRTLINLDSEDEGVFTIGCAGGADTTISLNVRTEPVPADARIFKLTVGGLKGGHSGIDIHKHRGNANKAMARALASITNESDMGLIALTGGSRKNAIPRDAQALMWFMSDKETQVLSAVKEMEKTLHAELASVDDGLFLKFESAPESEALTQAVTRQDTERVIWILLSLCNGVADMSAQLEGLVETSSNLATVNLKGNAVSVVSSQRSAVSSKLEAITASVHAVAGLAGAEARDSDVYPAWQPDMNSALLGCAEECYRRLYGQDPVIQVIHAGLECAVIGDIYPGMDMISFGPTLQSPHSPDERLFIPSISKVWDFLAALLKQLCN